MNQDDSFFCLSQVVENNKYFLYNKKKYPIDFNLIKRSSIYFKDHQSDFESHENIELKEPIEISEDSILTFINCCEYKKIKITDSIVFQINYLSIKYDVPELKQFTENYIEKNHNNLIFQSISFKHQLQNMTENQIKQNIIFDTNKEEEILANHLDDYFNDERIFTLPISSIDRIVKLYLKQNPNNQKHISNFLIDCLEKHKENASILFLNINFDECEKDLIIKLHNKFGEKFDFNMINSKSLFDTTYQLLSELNKVKIEMNEIVKQHENELNNFKEYKRSIDSQIEKFLQEQRKMNDKQKEFENNQNQFKDQLIQRQNSFEGKQNNFEIKINNIENTINENKRSFESSLSNINQKCNGFITKKI